MHVLRWHDAYHLGPTPTTEQLCDHTISYILGYCIHKRRNAVVHLCGIMLHSIDCSSEQPGRLLGSGGGAGATTGWWV